MDGHGDCPGPVRAATVPDLLVAQARRQPHRLALSARAAAGWRDRLTFQQLVGRTEATARGLLRHGLKEGDRVAVFLTNDAGREAFLTALGVLRIGAAFAPLNTRYADEGLRHALDLVEPAAVVTTRADADRFRTLGYAGPLLAVDGAGGAAQAWPDPLGETPDESRSAPPLPDSCDPDALACLLFTSGTTARPKAVMHTHRTMQGAGLCCGAALGLAEGDLYQAGWPFFTSSPMNIGAMSCWVYGAGFIFEEVLDNAGRLRLIETEGTTFYHGVPSILHFMAEEAERSGVSVGIGVGGLRRIGFGGAPMPREVSERIAALWPSVDLVQIYGLTESGPTGTVLPSPAPAGKEGSVGRAMPHCALAILDDDGFPVPRGDAGEIVITGPGVAVGYFHDAAATRAAFDGARVRTGDVGRVDAEGYLFFTDRKKDIINRGGLKVASLAVEQVLFRHPTVREAAVVAVPHPHLGEDVAACLVARPGTAIDVEELARFCADHLADYERPRRWLVLDELPKSPMGKVLKSELRDRLAPSR